jgi:hypothetical protein
MDKLKEIIRKKLKEMSATNVGGASFSAGQGEGYATPAAFASKTNAKGTKNIYYYKLLGFKNVPNIKPKSYDIKKLWEEEKEKTKAGKFQEDRINEFKQIEDALKELSPLLSNAKNETIEYYHANPGSYDIYKPSSMVLAYIQKAVDLLKQKQ